jgi:hypothetical protein
LVRGREPFLLARTRTSDSSSSSQDDAPVEDIATTAKTLPQFPQLWNQMVTGSVLDTGAVPVQPGSSPVPQRSDTSPITAAAVAMRWSS